MCDPTPLGFFRRAPRAGLVKWGVFAAASHNPGPWGAQGVGGAAASVWGCLEHWCCNSAELCPFQKLPRSAFSGAPLSWLSLPQSRPLPTLPSLVKPHGTHWGYTDGVTSEPRAYLLPTHNGVLIQGRMCWSPHYFLYQSVSDAESWTAAVGWTTGGLSVCQFGWAREGCKSRAGRGESISGLQYIVSIVDSHSPGGLRRTGPDFVNASQRQKHTVMCMSDFENFCSRSKQRIQHRFSYTVPIRPIRRGVG